jgi:hypothetical protein
VGCAGYYFGKAAGWKAGYRAHSEWFVRARNKLMEQGQFEVVEQFLDAMIEDAK